MGRNRCSTASSSVTSLLSGSSSGLSFSVAFNFLTPIPICRYVGCVLPRGPDAHVGCAQAQLRPACVPAARPATGGSAGPNSRDRRSRTISTGCQGVPTPTSGARRRNCAPRACLRHAPRPEVARGQIRATGGHAPSVLDAKGSRRPRRVRAGAIAPRVRACGTPRDRR